MNMNVNAAATDRLKKDYGPDLPALVVTPSGGIAIRAGTVVDGVALAETPIVWPDGGLVAGKDYAVLLADGRPELAVLASADLPSAAIGGFHFAPGGNAAARSGGDDKPAINPFSLWDLTFRPACPDPRGMALVDGNFLASRSRPEGAPRSLARPFWCDIYLLGADHLTHGTSSFGAVIADGDDPPQKPSQEAGTAEGRAGKQDNPERYDGLDYETAVAVMEHHGKQLLSYDEFVAAAFGVTERTAADKDPKRTGLDAPRTSKWGLMQAAGNMWTWGHDGDPDVPRASIFGGYWWGGVDAGSRHAHLAFAWPGASNDDLGARGRCDHLKPV